MASDLDAISTQDLLQRSLDPVQGASQPTANFSSFNSDRIIALDADSLNPRQASLIDNASRLSKVDYAPSSYLNQFRNQVPTQGQLQGSLIGSSTNPRLQLNASGDSSATTSSTTLDANTAEAGSIANGSFFAGLFTQGGRTADTRVLTAAQPLHVQWVGAFCDVDGTEVFPLSQSSNVVMSRLPEGEGDDDDDESIVPEVDFPTLESSSHIGEFDLFLPPSPSSSSSLTTFGAFTAASLTNPDLTLPGLNWVHLVDVYWVSPTQWSFTESLVLSFDLGNSVEDEGQESIVNGQGSNEDGPDGDDSSGDPDDDEDTGLDVESEWESSIGASRSGYFKFSFSASRGITTASAAGVRWSLLVDYLDSASVTAEASGRADFTPSDPSTNDDGGSSNGDDEPGTGGVEGGTGRDVIDTPQYPDDFTATSKWKASARISVETSGIIIVSSTPAIASDGEIDRTIAASITYDVEGDIEVSEEWSSSSQSGDISLVDFPVEDGDHPLGGCGTGIFDNGDAPGDGDNGEGEGGSGARGGRDPGTDPIGEVEGKGHASMSSGKSLNKAGGGLNGSFGLNGVLRNGRFSSLIGNALSDLETARENSGDGDHLFVFRDHKVTPVEYGQTVTTIVLKAGWTGIGKGDGSADGDGDTELGLNSEGVPQAVNDSTGVIDSDANGDGRDFVNLSFVETTTKNWNLMSEGLYGPIHHVGGSVDSFDLTYKSRSQGKSIGDVFGFASLQDRSADFESDLTGDGKSLLLVVTTHDYVEDINWMNYSGPTLTQLDEQYSQREDYFSKYDITGNATGVKNDDGSVSWTLDAKILDYSDVDYDYFSLYTTTETNTLDFFSNRVATFDAAKATRSTVVGGGTISPQPGGDTGGLTATESKSRSGDTEVSIIFAQTDTGEAATGLEIPVEKTDLELELEAMFSDYDEGDYSGGGSGGGDADGGTNREDETNPDGTGSSPLVFDTDSEVWRSFALRFAGQVLAVQNASEITAVTSQNWQPWKPRGFGVRSGETFPLFDRFYFQPDPYGFFFKYGYVPEPLFVEGTISDDIRYLQIGFTYSGENGIAPFIGHTYTELFADKSIYIDADNPNWRRAIAELRSLAKYDVIVVVGHGNSSSSGCFGVRNVRIPGTGEYEFLEELGMHSTGRREIWLRTCKSGTSRGLLESIVHRTGCTVFANTGTWAVFPWGDGRIARPMPNHGASCSPSDDDTWWDLR
jgi:hypothetical protein